MKQTNATHSYALPADQLAEMQARIDRESLVAATDPSARLSNEEIGDHHHESARVFTHNGRRIEIHTTYRIVIDGIDLPVSYQVLDNGSVHHHGLPQYATGSAIELTKRLVDELLVDDPGRGDASDHDHGSHQGGGH